MNKFDYYEMVIVVDDYEPGAGHCGKRGFILGLSDDDDPIYAVVIEGEGEVYCYNAECLSGTGYRIDKDCYNQNKFISDIFLPSIFDECARKNK